MFFKETVSLGAADIADQSRKVFAFIFLEANLTSP